MEEIYIPKQDYKVLVRCFTYNQSKYIEDALNGFAMQKTDFPFVCLVMDDCSTDGELGVIKAWMKRECDMEKAEYIEIELSNVILVPHKSNEYCTFAFYFLKHNLYGTGEKKMKHVTPWREHCDYEAMCEGDDYWIDPLKLQKQVEYLDKHAECGLVYCNRQILNDATGVVDISKTEKPFTKIEQLLLENFISTLTVCLRSKMLVRYEIEVDPYSKNWKMGDYPMWIWFALHSDLHYIPDVVATYRVLPNTASHTSDLNRQISFMNSLNDIRVYFAQNYIKDKDITKKVENEYYFGISAVYLRYHSYKLFLKNIVKVSPKYLFKRIRRK